MGSYAIKRTDEEIDAVLNYAHESEDVGRATYPGMTFDQGVAQGIEWLTGLLGDEAPLP